MALAPYHPATDASQPAPEPEIAPLWLPWDLRLSLEQFERVCQANPEAVLELAADGQLIAMTPTGGETSSRNSQLILELGWALRRSGLDYRLFDSSGGFRLPDGSVFSPDASLVQQARWQALSPQQRRGFPPLCPDLVVELASPSDEGPRGISALRRKLDLYQANGAQLGWLLLPEERAVEIWRAGQQGMAERLENAARLEPGEPFAGLTLELQEIWTV
ncbi:MAG: Uma2 family endonuclease [Synechococcaceae cyanobacterium]|nr:Uma2 family endonuclease [Synechococcaceae cyanobacterium]